MNGMNSIQLSMGWTIARHLRGIAQEKQTNAKESFSAHVKR